MPLASRNAFLLVLTVTLLVKLVLASIIPMSGDEAYFLQWGVHPDWGFYDHPPMVGWFLQGMLWFGYSEALVRLPVILLTALIGVGIYLLLRRDDEERARLVAILYWVSPINVLNVLVTTDTPLILFSFLSAASLYLAMRRDSLALHALSGAFLGMAFLSKYFSVLLGFAYLVIFLLADKRPRRWRGFALLVASALPFVALNLWWNCGHCWANVMFNLFNRHEGDHLSLKNPLVFLGTQLYLVTPFVGYYLVKERTRLREATRNAPLHLFAWMFLVPMTVFALLSPVKTIGLHWVLSFYPFFYLWLFVALKKSQLESSVKWVAAFTLLHLLLIAAIAATPMEAWKKWSSKYDGIVFMFKTSELLEQLRPYEQDFILATDGYSAASIISYHARRVFPVFGEGSSHARHDDILTDFRPMDGRNILILKKSEPDLAQFTPYFRSVEVRRIELHGAPFYLVLGNHFDYPRYREKVLRFIKDKYYAIPRVLPQNGCYFCDRYFPGEACVAGAKRP